MTLDKLLDDTAQRLRAARLHYGHGTENPRDEAAFLVLRGLGLAFDADLSRPVSAAQRRRIESLVGQRIGKRVPTAYLLHEAWLDGHAFHVDRRVIVPRSHIAGLLHGARLKRAPRRVLDLCTGSGCLAVLAALAFPRARIDAADLSAAALKVARVNVARYRLQRRIRLVRSDLFAALGRQRYDLVISNPPYVSAASMSKLPAEHLHEPHSALAGGRDGLELVNRIIAQAGDHLNPGGMLVCEIGDNRKALERQHTRARLLWPQDEVFILEAGRSLG